MMYKSTKYNFKEQMKLNKCHKKKKNYYFTGETNVILKIWKRVMYNYAF